MPDIIEDKKPIRVGNRRVHMANERTFLAWIRTSIGLMAFGIVLERFALFVKQMSCVLGQSNLENLIPPSHGYSAIAGVSLVVLGALMSLFAYFRYKQVEKQIIENTYQSFSLLTILLTCSVLTIGIIFLAVYLAQNTRLM